MRDQMGTIDFGGIERQAHLALLENPKVGDIVLVHAGVAIQTWSPQDYAEYQALMESAQTLAAEP
jgi:hydrogenase expression/formation protein HypC